jgi:hypothetical protein
VASVEKRTRADSRPVYIVKWRTPAGQHRTKGGFATKKAAENYRIKQEEAKLRGVEFDPKAGGVLFRDAAQAWLASRSDCWAPAHPDTRPAPTCSPRGLGSD